MQAAPETARSVLVVQTQGLGDLVMAVPILRVIRGAWPTASITVAVGSPAARALLQPTGLADDILVAPPRSSVAFARFCLRLRRQRHTAAVVATNQHRSWSFILRRVVGIPQVVADASLALPPSTHRVVANNRLGRTLTATSTDDLLGPTLAVTAEDTARARRMRHALGIADGAPVIGVHPGSEPNAPQKRYPGAQLRATIATILARRPDAHAIMFFGGELSDDRADYRALHPRSHLVEDATIGEVAALLKGCDVVLSGDTGLAHIAAAVGTPTVVIAGPTQIECTRPWGDGHTIITTSDPSVTCMPCYGTPNYEACPFGRRCLTTLPPDIVAQAVEARLDSAPRRDVSTAPRRASLGA